MSNAPHRPLLRLVGALALALVTLVVTSPAGSAEVPPLRFKTVAETGLFTLHRGHTVHLNLVELGGVEAEPTEVVLRLRDTSDRVVALVRGELAAGQPLRLTMPGPSAGYLVVRAEAVLLASTTNFATAPVLSLEVANNATLDTFVATTCAIPYDPEGTGGPVLGDCGGCHFEFAFEP